MAAPRTTSELLALLDRLGFAVTANQIRLDTQDGYLPPPRRIGGRTERGVFGEWDPWAVRRAVYLYRLRRLGLLGPLLRVLLFLRDGWGWERVRPLCQSGLRKLLGATVSKRRRRHRRTLTKDALDFTADLDEDGMTKGEHRVDRFITGTLLVGTPIEGGSLRPLLDQLAYVAPTTPMSSDLRTAEETLARSSLTRHRYEDAVRQATEDQGRTARECFASMRSPCRRMFRELMRPAIAPGTRFSPNPLTLFGIPPKLLDELLNGYPGRPTRAQLLAAAVLAPSLVLHMLLDEGVITDDPAQEVTMIPTPAI